MSARLDIFPGRAVALAPAFCAPAARFAVIVAHGGRVAVDVGRRFDKRFKSTHRCTVADVRGPLTLTVPVDKPASYRTATWADITVSPHGNWPPVMVTALESAYGRTPFFEFYIDRIAPLLLAAPGRRLVDLDHDLEALICRFLSIPYVLGCDYADVADAPEIPPPALSEPYWQVRADKLGFIPELSVLDVLFNLGPDASLYIGKLVDALRSVNKI